MRNTTITFQAHLNVQNFLKRVIIAAMVIMANVYFLLSENKMCNNNTVIEAAYLIFTRQLVYERICHDFGMYCVHCARYTLNSYDETNIEILTNHQKVCARRLYKCKTQNRSL